MIDNNEKIVTKLKMTSILKTKLNSLFEPNENEFPFSKNKKSLKKLGQLNKDKQINFSSIIRSKINEIEQEEINFKINPKKDSFFYFQNENKNFDDKIFDLANNQEKKLINQFEKTEAFFSHKINLLEERIIKLQNEKEIIFKDKEKIEFENNLLINKIENQRNNFNLQIEHILKEQEIRIKREFNLILEEIKLQDDEINKRIRLNKFFKESSNLNLNMKSFFETEKKNISSSFTKLEEFKEIGNNLSKNISINVHNHNIRKSSLSEKDNQLNENYKENSIYKKNNQINYFSKNKRENHKKYDSEDGKNINNSHTFENKKKKKNNSFLEKYKNLTPNKKQNDRLFYHKIKERAKNSQFEFEKEIDDLREMVFKKEENFLKS